MKTFQDLLAVLGDENKLLDFLTEAVYEHRLSPEYRTAAEALAYWRNENPTITRYQKLLYTISGRAVPDNYSANYKLASNVYFRFVTQTVQYLLGNGALFDNPSTKKRLGGDEFDLKLQLALTKALNGGVSFGFMNYNKLEVFGITEFVPLYDEENGALAAGIRFWQIDSDKPLRLTLYESDGYTEYIQRKDGSKPEVMCPKRAYKQNVIVTGIDGRSCYEGENYPGFPIIPLYSPRRQSSIVGFRRQIDCYDLIESGFANDIDDASMIYWTISNAGGMDDIDLAKFVEHMKTVKAAVVDDDGAKAEAHTTDVPYESREAMLTRLETEMYRDFMVLNNSMISGGSSTATAIKAAYEPMNLYSNLLESCVLEFVGKLLALLEIDDRCTFKRDSIVNELEKARTVQTKVSTALMLKGVFDDETIIRLCAQALELSDEDAQRIIEHLGSSDAERAAAESSGDA